MSMSAERKVFFMNPLSPSIPKQLGKMDDNFVIELKKREAEWERKWNQAFGRKKLEVSKETVQEKSETRGKRMRTGRSEKYPEYMRKFRTPFPWEEQPDQAGKEVTAFQPDSKTSVSPEPTQKEVEEAAYLDWLNSGGTHGHDVPDYYKAQNRLREGGSKTGSSAMSTKEQGIVPEFEQKIEELKEKANLRKEYGQRLANLLANLRKSRNLAREERYSKKHLAKEKKRQRLLEKQEAKTSIAEKKKAAEKPRKQPKKTPIEAQGIWKKLTHEERLINRLRIKHLEWAEKQKKLSILMGQLSQLGKRKQNEIDSKKEPVAEKGKKVSGRQKILAWIGAGLLGAAAIGGAVWGIHEATETDRIPNVSKIHVMDRGETLIVGPNSVISGDVLVNGIRMFDNREETGLIVELQKKAKVTAPWGATVNEGIANQELMDQIATQITEEIKRVHPEITEVDVVIFPGENPQESNR